MHAYKHRSNIVHTHTNPVCLRMLLYIRKGKHLPGFLMSALSTNKRLAVISHRTEEAISYQWKYHSSASTYGHVDENVRPGEPHAALLWSKCLCSNLSTQTQTFIYLNPTHGQPVCSCVCVVGWDTGHAIHSVDNRFVCHGSYSRGIRIYFPCAPIWIIFILLSHIDKMQ